MISKTFRTVLIFLSALMLFAGCGKTESDKIYVYAGAGIKNVLYELISVYKADTGSKTDFSCVLESAGKSAKLIQEGADANIYMCASTKWMNEMKKNSLIEEGTDFILARNSLVLIASEKAEGKISTPADILKALGKDGKIALGDPVPVPAGQYAKNALTKAGIYDTLNKTKKAAYYENVRKVLNAVEMNQADFGIVYNSDAAASAKVKVIYTFPEADHGPIVFPAAAVKGHYTKETAAFLDFLKSEKAKDIIQNKYLFK